MCGGRRVDLLSRRGFSFIRNEQPAGQLLTMVLELGDRCYDRVKLGVRFQDFKSIDRTFYVVRELRA